MIRTARDLECDDMSLLCDSGDMSPLWKAATCWRTPNRSKLAAHACLFFLLIVATSALQAQDAPERASSLEQTCIETLQNLPEEGFTSRAVPWRHELAPGQVLLYEMQAFIDNQYVLCLVADGTPPFMVFTDEGGTPVPVDFTTSGNTVLVRFTSPITGAILIRIKNDENQPLPVAFLYAFQ